MEGRIPVIAGCTASGKSSAAMEIASALPGVEIVSADSRQFYRGMDIGTAKPLPGELERVPHHMVNIADPDVLLSAGWYAGRAMEVIEDILNRGGTPLVVGGSALYIMSLAGLLDDLPPRNDSVRNTLGALEDQVPGALHRLLAMVDEAEAETVGRFDRVRLLRSLEIAIISGERPSALKGGGNPDGRFRFALLDTEGDVLKERIRRRTAVMMENGLVEEVKGLLDAGYEREPVLGATIGYAEVLDHIQGKTTLEEAREAISTNTWRYARRQRNMFRRLPGAVRVPRDTERITEVLFKERISHG